MAGDWIKMRNNLWNDPRISRICDITDQPEAMVIGGLYWLWSTADEHTEDGFMHGLSLRGIDRKTGVQGLGEALAAVGWVEEHADGLQIVRFGEHNGVSAKRRSMEAQRKANARKASAKYADKPQTPSGEDAELDLDLETDIPPVVPPQAEGRTRGAVQIDTFIHRCKESGEKVIPEGDAVFRYAEEVGLPLEFVRLAYREFVERNRARKKRYKDWRQAFQNCVRENWYRLWWADNDGNFQLTTNGVQAQKAEEAMRRDAA